MVKATMMYNKIPRRFFYNRIEKKYNQVFEVNVLQFQLLTDINSTGISMFLNERS